MSENQKYFYMRLKENFFNSPELIAVESMDSGYLYSNILLKMYLLSLRENGRLMAGAIPYSPQMLSRATGHDVKTVEEAIQVFSDVGLIEVLDSGAIFMLDIQNFVGQSTTEADRKREYRDRIAAEKRATDKCLDKCLDKSTPYIELEPKREIERKREPEKQGLMDNVEMVKGATSHTPTHSDNPDVNFEKLRQEQIAKLEQLSNGGMMHGV